MFAAPSKMSSEVFLKYPDMGITVSLTGSGSYDTFKNMLRKEGHTKTAFSNTTIPVKVSTGGNMAPALKAGISTATARSPGSAPAVAKAMDRMNTSIQNNAAKAPISFTGAGFGSGTGGLDMPTKLQSDNPTWIDAYAVAYEFPLSKEAMEKSAGALQSIGQWAGLLPKTPGFLDHMSNAFSPLLQAGRQGIGRSMEQGWNAAKSQGAMDNMPKFLQGGISSARDWLQKNHNLGQAAAPAAHAPAAPGPAAAPARPASSGRGLGAPPIPQAPAPAPMPAPAPAAPAYGPHPEMTGIHGVADKALNWLHGHMGEGTLMGDAAQQTAKVMREQASQGSMEIPQVQNPDVLRRLGYNVAETGTGHTISNPDAVTMAIRGLGGHAAIPPILNPTIEGLKPHWQEAMGGIPLEEAMKYVGAKRSPVPGAPTPTPKPAAPNPPGPPAPDGQDQGLAGRAMNWLMGSRMMGLHDQ